MLRAAGATVQALWYDEIAVLVRTDVPGPVAVVSNLLRDNQAPLYDLGMWVITRLGDPGAFVLRLPSVAAGAALVPVVGALTFRVLRPFGRRLAGRAALLAGAWVALTPGLVRYAQEMRPYALLVLLTAWCWWAAVRLRDTRGRRGHVALGVGGAALALVHYYGVLAFAPIALWVVLAGGRFGARRGRAAWALLTPLAALLAWAPAALYQLRTRTYAGIYRPLDGGGLLEVLDAVGLHGPLATATGREVWGDGAGLVLLTAGRTLTVVLAFLAAGTWWRRREARRAAARPPFRVGDAVAPAAGPARPGDLGLRVAVASTAVGGSVLLAAGGLLPVDGLSQFASAVLKQGRALDADNLAFLGDLLAVMRVSGAGALALAVAMHGWPRLLPDGRRAPGAVSALMLGVLFPPAAVFLADVLLKPTFAPRNLLVVAPSLAVLVGAGLALLSRVPRRAVCALLLLVAIAGLVRAQTLNDRRPWPGVALHLLAERFREPSDVLAFPAWISRCVEHHAAWPWGTVANGERPAEVETWVASRDRVALVHAYGALRNPRPVLDALARSHRRTRVHRLDGVVLETWVRR